MDKTLQLARERLRLLAKHKDANYKPMWFHPYGYIATKCSYRILDILIYNDTFLVKISVNRVVEIGTPKKGETSRLRQDKAYLIPIQKMGKGFAG